LLSFQKDKSCTKRSQLNRWLNVVPHVVGENRQFHWF